MSKSNKASKAAFQQRKLEATYDYIIGTGHDGHRVSAATHDPLEFDRIRTQLWWTERKTENNKTEAKKRRETDAEE